MRHPSQGCCGLAVILEVSRTGMTFRAARIAGPTHHFLSVEFQQSSDEPYAILYAETQQDVIDKDVVSCVQHAVEGCADLLPIHGRYDIKRLLISARDRPSLNAYRGLLRRIISAAAEELAA